MNTDSAYLDNTEEFDTDEKSIDENMSYAPLSPYLDYDPLYLPTQPEYLFPYGQKRGRFEHSFYYIGASCMGGATIGGCRGFYNGLHLTTLAGQTGSVRRTRILNHIMKQGAATSSTLGSIALIYSGLGVLLTTIRGVDDEMNCLCAATLTGGLSRLPGGLYKCAIGGAVGLGLASLYCIIAVRDKIYFPTESLDLLLTSHSQDSEYYNEKESISHRSYR